MKGPATEALERSLKGVSYRNDVPPKAFLSGPLAHRIRHAVEVEWQDDDYSFPLIYWQDNIFEETRTSQLVLNLLTKNNFGKGRRRGLVRSKAFRKRLSLLNRKPASLVPIAPSLPAPVDQTSRCATPAATAA